MADFFLDSALSVSSPADDGTGPTKLPLVCLASQYRYPLQHCFALGLPAGAGLLLASWPAGVGTGTTWYLAVRAVCYMCGPGSHPGAPHRNSEFRRKVVDMRCWVMLGLFACRVQTARRGLILSSLLSHLGSVITRLVPSTIPWPPVMRHRCRPLQTVIARSLPRAFSCRLLLPLPDGTMADYGLQIAKLKITAWHAVRTKKRQSQTLSGGLKLRGMLSLVTGRTQGRGQRTAGAEDEAGLLLVSHHVRNVGLGTFLFQFWP